MTKKELSSNSIVKTSPLGSHRFTRYTLLPIFTIMDTTHKLALALVTAVPASTQRLSGHVLINMWKNNVKYLSFILG